MVYVPETWVDDDGTGTTGTSVTADRMNNIEQGVANAHVVLSWQPAAATVSVNVNVAAPGAIPLDGGVSLPPYNDRVLLLGQTNPVENGLYDYTSGFSGPQLGRTPDADADGDFRQGREVYVIAGPYADQHLVYVGFDYPRVDIDPITFHAPTAGGSKAFAFLMAG